ncbi:tetratricopeptide repeat protein, partial [Candidatus Sumerlaeota bacterium]|nr:tetratricopeptide repeat protein [Candidatus Sumerlaeota bacterium]
YEYGELMWKAARCRMALGDTAGARELYRRLVARHNYAEAQLEYAEVLESIGEREEAAKILKTMVLDAGHAPKFQQRRDRGFIRQARKRLAAQGVKV